MSITKSLGGDRLGSGKKMKVHLKNYERSTHDRSYIWRSTMSAGTLVPYMVEVGLPGDTFDIDLNADVKTHPTLGPLFGSFKLQLDVFVCPIRLYQGQLHNNKLGIGMDMAKINLPLILTGIGGYNGTNFETDGKQINSSSILNYLGFKGVQLNSGNIDETLIKLNAVPYLSYWDIYKNYYANKQEEIGAVISNQSVQKVKFDIIRFNLKDGSNIIVNNFGSISPAIAVVDVVSIDVISYETGVYNNDTLNAMIAVIGGGTVTLKQISAYTNILDSASRMNFILTLTSGSDTISEINSTNVGGQLGINIQTFDLSNLDDMREDILSQVKIGTPYIINESSIEPYSLPFKVIVGNYSKGKRPIAYNQEGLALKTYQSDIFNNWLSTEWIDGTNGINAITSIDTSSGEFSLDTLNLAKKVYDMLNRIAVSGGSYNDWLEAVWSHESFRGAESPIYMGGMSEEIVFQEVVSNSESAGGEQPLGTLAGRGKNVNRKGGFVRVKIDEPSYIMGIVSITPRVDYSQGNEWYNEIRTMDDFHKPALDQIGFQDLPTYWMAYWEQKVTAGNIVNLKSAGKQPAWVNYMTNFNKTFGGFAEEDNQMFMTLNRRYEAEANGNQMYIKDLTSYIDPSKFNYAFAQTDLNAQNFWVQLGVDITARRKMSAKIMPNL